jgi:hypothetical protein
MFKSNPQNNEDKEYWRQLRALEKHDHWRLREARAAQAAAENREACTTPGYGCSYYHTQITVNSNYRLETISFTLLTATGTTQAIVPQ